MATQAILEMLRRDLATFADPAQPVEVTERGATWLQQREVLSVEFLRGPGELPLIRCAGREYGYVDFVASEHVADLRALAESIRHETANPGVYVSPVARREDGADEPASDLVRSLCSANLPFASTRVAFLRGAAGAGKTVFLRQLTAEAADAYLAGRQTFLYLYVDAQGRSLSRIDELMARLLQDYRAKFTYHAVATLTRLQLLVPIIDGFDELLGVGGYTEAFQSLAKFLSRLDGRGGVLASARSTFYEFQDFGQSAARYADVGSLSFEIVPLDLQPWGRPQVAEYLRQTGSAGLLGTEDPTEGAARLYEFVGDGNRDLLQTPFFVASAIDLLREGRSVSGRLVAQLVELFAEREVRKLRDNTGRPLADLAGHMFFLELLAEEMWWQQARELDVETTKTIAELAGEHLGLAAGAALRFVELAPSYAFLRRESRDGDDRLAFQHEYFFAFFLGRLLARYVTDANRETSRFLSRSSLPFTVAEEFAAHLPPGAAVVATAVAFLGSRAVPALSRDLNRSNAGVLYTGLVNGRPGDLHGTALAQADFLQADFRQSCLEAATFQNCSFVRPDLQGARWRSVLFESCSIGQPIVSRGATRLESCRLVGGTTLVGLLLAKDNAQESVFDPVRVAQIASEMGLEAELPAEEAPPALSEEAEAHIQLLRKLLRRSGRLFHLSDEDLQDAGILHSRQWPALLELLKKHDLIVSEHIRRRGPSGQVWRLTVPPSEIERGEAGVSRSSRITSFWKDVRTL